MKKEIKIKKEFVETVDVVCNKCGKSCRDSIGMNYEGLLDAAVHAGYGSNYLYDTASYKFDLCEKCVHELMKSFLIAPETSDYMHGGSPHPDEEFVLKKLYNKGN